MLVEMIELIDTHCHIHEAWRSVNGPDATARLWDKGGRPAAEEIIAGALQAGVGQMICVGTTLVDSQMGIEFAAQHDHVVASIGIHPHEAKSHVNFSDMLKKFASLADKPKVVAVGECGLDFFYEHSPREEQERALRFQIELALEHDLPMIFHVREAFEDFWRIFDDYHGIRGVIHSFSAGEKELAQVVERGLHVGLNGIMTFTKKAEQLAAARAVPLDRLLLETDAPFLTPEPFRGKICLPEHVRVTAEFLAELRGEALETLAAATTANAKKLFRL